MATKRELVATVGERYRSSAPAAKRRIPEEFPTAAGGRDAAVSRVPTPDAAATSQNLAWTEGPDTPAGQSRLTRRRIRLPARGARCRTTSSQCLTERE